MHTQTNLAAKHFDGRNPAGNKLYLIVCIQLEQILQLNDAVHSAQPQVYFKCLLDGKRVEPGLGAKTYSSILDQSGDGQLAIDGEEGPEAIADEPNAAIENADIDSDVDLADARAALAILNAPRTFITAGKAATAPGAAAVVPVPFALRPVVLPLPPAGNSSNSSSASSSHGDDTDSEVDVSGNRSGRFTCHLELNLSQIYIGLKTVTRTKDELLSVLIIKGAEKKKRTIAASTIHGQVEPLAFLTVWSQMVQT